MPEAEPEPFDLDKLLAYDTIKEVRVLDRRLGFVYYVVLGMVIFYVIIYCFIIKKQYLDREKSNGFVMTKVINPSYANDTIPFDIFDSLTNPGESGAVFIPTRVLITRDQSQKDSCENPGYPCESNAQCDTGDEIMTGECKNKMCVRRGWCPAESVAATTTEIYKIDALKYDLWFQAKVLFHKFQADTANIDDPSPVYYPNKKANTYPLHDVLRLASVELEDVWKEGAVIQVLSLFDCNLDADIFETRLEASLIDATTGFNYKHARYYEEGGEMKRDVYHYYGLRLIIFSTGLGEMTSFAQIVLQTSQAIALLGCAGTVADIFLQYIVPERNHYIEEKIKKTEDFGDDN